MKLEELFTKHLRVPAERPYVICEYPDGRFTIAGPRAGVISPWLCGGSWSVRAEAERWVDAMNDLHEGGCQAALSRLPSPVAKGDPTAEEAEAFARELYAAGSQWPTLARIPWGDLHNETRGEYGLIARYVLRRERGLIGGAK